jgi:hypothetical protein
MLCVACEQSQSTFFVSPAGDDQNAGTEVRPFSTLEHARDAIRAYKAQHETLPEEGFTVYLRGLCTRVFALRHYHAQYFQQLYIVFQGCLGKFFATAHPFFQFLPGFIALAGVVLGFPFLFGLGALGLFKSYYHGLGLLQLGQGNVRSSSWGCSNNFS